MAAVLCACIMAASRCISDAENGEEDMGEKLPVAAARSCWFRMNVGHVGSRQSGSLQLLLEAAAEVTAGATTDDVTAVEAVVERPTAAAKKGLAANSEDDDGSG